MKTDQLLILPYSDQTQIYLHQFILRAKSANILEEWSCQVELPSWIIQDTPSHPKYWNNQVSYIL